MILELDSLVKIIWYFSQFFKLCVLKNYYILISEDYFSRAFGRDSWIMTEPGPLFNAGYKYILGNIDFHFAQKREGCSFVAGEIKVSILRYLLI